MTRTGIGYDIHRLVENRQLILGGVEIPFEKGLEGHSDADVLTHAVCDALLGAAALGDIGQHFPDTHPLYKDASSLELLRRVCEMVAFKNFHIENVDATVLAERPKLAAYLEAMRQRLAETLQIPVACVNLKAKTNEALDAVGRGEAIAAQAIATLRTLPKKISRRSFLLPKK